MGVIWSPAELAGCASSIESVDKSRSENEERELMRGQKDLDLGARDAALAAAYDEDEVPSVTDTVQGGAIRQVEDPDRKLEAAIHASQLEPAKLALRSRFRGFCRSRLSSTLRRD